MRNVRPSDEHRGVLHEMPAWTPENFTEGIPGYDSLDKVYYTLNPHEHTLVIVTMRRVPVQWAHIDEIYNWDWQLYVCIGIRREVCYSFIIRATPVFSKSWRRPSLATTSNRSVARIYSDAWLASTA